MTRETRIGLLVGLVFIVMFGVVLTELTGTKSSEPARIVEEPSALNWMPTIEDISPAIVPPAPALAQAGKAQPAEPNQAPAPGVALAAAEPVGAGSGAETEVPAGPEPVPAAQSALAPAAPSGQTPVPEVIRHTVRPKDSLIKIARMYYGPGNGKLYRRILQANRDVIKDESLLQVGQVLRIPPLEGAVSAAGPTRVGPGPSQTATNGPMLLEAQAVRKPSGRVYIVRRGDNLTKIARKTLHDDSRSAAMKIFNANRDKLKDPDHLPVGIKLQIPI